MVERDKILLDRPTLDKLSKMNDEDWALHEHIVNERIEREESDRFTDAGLDDMYTRERDAAASRMIRADTARYAEEMDRKLVKDSDNGKTQG